MNLLLILMLASTPKIYSHTGKAVVYITPADPDVRHKAFVFDDYTMVETAGSYNTAADPLWSMFQNDKHPDEFQNGPNGLKYHVVGEFKYREDAGFDNTAAICTPVEHSKAPDPVEACYEAFPRDPSILSEAQRPGRQGIYNAEVTR